MDLLDMHDRAETMQSPRLCSTNCAQLYQIAVFYTKYAVRRVCCELHVHALHVFEMRRAPSCSTAHEVQFKNLCYEGLPRAPLMYAVKVFFISNRCFLHILLLNKTNR